MRKRDWITWLKKLKSVREIVARCKTSWYNEGKIQGQIEGLSKEEEYQQGWHDALEKQVALSIMNFLDKNTLGMCLSNMECKDLEYAVVDSDWAKIYDYMKKKLEKQGGQNSTWGKDDDKQGQIEGSSKEEEYQQGWHDVLESEDDDKIRKAIILFFELQDDNTTYCLIPKKDILAWLEKQGEKDKLIQELGEYKVKYTQEVLGQHLEKYYTDPYNGVCFDCYGHHWGMCARDSGIEITMDGKPIRQFSYKDCEQTFGGKSALESIKEVKVDNSNSTNVAPFYYEHTIIDQKDFASKVDPKFKVGDWVVTRYGTVNQVIAVDEDGDGFTLDDDTYFSGSWKDNYHLWTIQDAKDGDVLVRNNDMLSICIFSHFDGINNKFSSFLCHCGLEGEGLGQELSINGYHDDSKNYLPATKEQRDLLFQKMEEAGYEWDAETKEVKKIENEIEIPFGAKDSESQEVTYYIPKGFHAEIDDDKVVIKKGEKPSEWSEDDENMVNDIIAAIDTLYYHGMVNWLKSLKQRIRG